MLTACRAAPHDDRREAAEPVSAPAASSAPTASSESSSVPVLPPGTHQHVVARPGGAVLRYTLFVPSEYGKAGPAPLIVALHYAGEVTPFYGRGMIDGLVRPAFADLQAVIVAPDSLGGHWTTDENEAAVVWLVREVMKSYAVDPHKVVLTGYSMGGIGTWFIGSKHQDQFTAAIPVASAPAGDADWRIPLYVIHSTDDEILPIAPVREHVARLRARGARIEWREVSRLSHYNTGAFVPALRDASSWLAQLWGGSGPPAR